ncbi:retinol dehydrogenase 11 [Aphidius gifuensis]|uniref:retinol dehydrogenase 11 n=1 Tax=Aphidius gifuensis TaxID=684658 RepID=UPI001CDBB98C|nr:retinol dehydrogenase 11 [Aphidius gifuensis]XP_044003188.1 retinol dehydrogenase 11 [Aphidius gifuensis]
MFVVVATTLALATSLLVYLSSKKYWNIIAQKIIIDIKFNLLGAKENLRDILQAKYNKTDLPCKSGMIAIVTGGSRGIGLAVVKMLLECNMTVIIGCRRIEAGEKAVKNIRELGVIKGKARIYKLDNSSLKSVREFVDKVKQEYEKINILINNAGVMFTPYMETSEGFEYQWGVNYLSHFLLTALLMPLLCNDAKKISRVINVSSCGHLLGNINFDDINYRQTFMSNAAYAQSKLAQVIFTKILQDIADRKNLPIRSYAVHPGIVNTDLFENSLLYKFKWFMNIFLKTPEQGAVTIVYTSISDKIENLGGSYFSNCIKSPVHPLADDKLIREKLLKLSLQQVELVDFLQYL